MPMFTVATVEVPSMRFVLKRAMTAADPPSSLAAFDRSTNRRLWSVQVGEEPRRLEQIGGVLLVEFCFSGASFQCMNQAFEGRTGKMLWREGGQWVKTQAPLVLLMDTFFFRQAENGDMLERYKVMNVITGAWTAFIVPTNGQGCPGGVGNIDGYPQFSLKALTVRSKDACGETLIRTFKPEQ